MMQIVGLRCRQKKNKGKWKLICRKNIDTSRKDLSGPVVVNIR
jgi:hypothetical protein